ncbi:MAG: 5-(carboxyamino)imidazole ribonucleotide synthase [Chromatiales bacterium]|jgi:5-(carboxyamino)imidazole ribonucleotide synthase|nr:5-(carboxyamino)imidazole ribonucleotide synthase [Chromatiales bacterium]
MNNSSSPRIGVIGGGQLAAMLATAAASDGVSVTALDPTEHSPARIAGAAQITGDLFDEARVRELVEASDVTTVELEQVPTELLATLASEGHHIIPAPEVIGLIADKLRQKQAFADNNISTSPFEAMAYPSEAQVLRFGLPCVQKAAKGGYDGRGVAVLKDPTDLEYLLPVPGFIEAFVPQALELGVIVAQDAEGAQCVYPVTEMRFNDAGNLLDYLVSPARISTELASDAAQLASDAVRALGGEGIFGVELFVTEDGRLLVNEMAPRTHNCGHFTIDACETSQFAQQLRILLGLPLGSATQRQPAAMVNLLGADGFDGPTVVEGLETVSNLAGVHVYLYGKEACRPLRKMGHLTALGDSVDEALARARTAAAKLRIRGEHPL